MGCTTSKSTETTDSVSKQNKQPCSPAPANGTANGASSEPPKDANGTPKAKNGDIHQHSVEPASLNASVAENNQEKPHVLATNHNGKCGAEGEREGNTASTKNGDIVRIDDIHVETSEAKPTGEQEIKAGVQCDVDSRIVTEQLTTHATGETNEGIAVTHVDHHKPLEAAFHVAETDAQKHDEPEKVDQHDEAETVKAPRHEAAGKPERTDYVALQAVAANQIYAEGEKKVLEVESQPQVESAAPLETAAESVTQAADHHPEQFAEVIAEAEILTEKQQEAAPEVEEQPQVTPAALDNEVEQVHADDHHHHTESDEQVTEEVVPQENVSEEAVHSEPEHATPLEAEPEESAHVEPTELVAVEVDNHEQNGEENHVESEQKHESEEKHEESEEKLGENEEKHEESEEKVAEDLQLEEHVASHEAEAPTTNAVDHAEVVEQSSANSKNSTEVTFPAVPKSADNEVSREDTQPLSPEVEVANDNQSVANLSAEADEVAAAETSHSDHASHHDDAASKSQDDLIDTSNSTDEPNEQSTATEQPVDQTEN